jgi:hypothetical protein
MRGAFDDGVADMLSFGNGRSFQPFRLLPHDFNHCVEHIAAASDGLEAPEESATGITHHLGVIPDGAS